ncbi:MAG: S41 family peptidase [Actinobacteria bacterium]|nr:S41 family peptidase [Actinomycetota bacterium]
MKRKIVIAAVSLFIAVIIFSGGFLSGYILTGAGDYFSSIIPGSSKPSVENEESSVKNSSDKDSGILAISETIDYVLANALNEKTRQELIRAAIEGILTELQDRYADYFPKEEYEKIMESYSGTMSGIGVVVTIDDEGQVLIIKTIEGTPAHKKGVKEGDIIIAVNGKDIKDMALDQVVAMIKGKEGTAVNIKIFRPSENKNIDFKITRQRFYVPNYFVDVVDDGIIYIQYIDFQEKGAEKLNGELKKVLGSEANGIILDLRNNLGGILDDAVAFCDLFLDKGVIVTVRGRSNNQESFEEFDAKKGGYTEIPVVVLINGYSASAAELAAGALKDNGRAVIVGEKSFGKGTVQVLNNLSDGSGIKYTTAKYYLPSGATIDGVGIEPDITVILTPEDTEDMQLNRAVEEIKKMIGNQS